MTDILQLPGWEVTETYTQGNEHIIEAKYIQAPSGCQKCGAVGNLYKHGTKGVSYRDTPFFGQHGILKATLQRYRCLDCKETFVQTPKGIEPERRMTTRCVEYIKRQCLEMTFTSLSNLVGCVEGTVRNIAGSHVEQLDRDYRPHLPEWLGIDETKLDKGMRCIITDIGNNRPIDILLDRDKTTLATWLSQFKDRSGVKGLAIDMWKPYKDVAEVMFKDLPVVIDKFHVVRMANTAVDRVRIRVQKAKDRATRVEWKRSKLMLVKRPQNLSDKQRLNLMMWLDNEPEVAEAYRIKESFFAIYDMPKEQAIEAFDAFPKMVPASMKAEWNDLTRAMKNWRKEILAYFDHPITNGYTEALNGVAKVINRAGRGYSFQIMRARILYRQKAQQPAPLDDVEMAILTTLHNHAALRKRLILEAANTCACCRGIYADQDLHLHRMGVRYDDQPEKNMAVLCSYCHVRIHTEGVIHDDSLST